MREGRLVVTRDANVAVTPALPEPPRGRPVVTSVHPLRAPEPDLEAADDEPEDPTTSPRPHLSLVVTVGDGVMTASRRDSMARHPSADHKT